MYLFSRDSTASSLFFSEVNPPYTLFIILLILLAGMSAPSRAHEPIFMISPEAPGQGAIDLHMATHINRADEKEFEQEVELTYGITRNIAARFTLPFLRSEEDTDSGQVTKNGLADPSISLKWRFLNRNWQTKKHAAAVVVSSTIPVGSGKGLNGRSRPNFLFGITQGLDVMKWNYAIDARYQFNVAANGTKSGDKLFLDASYGLRPRIAKAGETDIVFLLEFNYLHEFNSIVSGVNNTNTGGDFFFLSPEILIAPTNRHMFKGGVQIPVAQARNGTAEAKGLTYVMEFEIRF